MRISDWSSDVCSSDLRSDGSLPALGSGGTQAVQPRFVPPIHARLRRKLRGGHLCRPAQFAWRHVEHALESAAEEGIAVVSRLAGYVLYRQACLVRVAQRIERRQIGRAHGCTPVTNAHTVCLHLLEK